MEPFLTPAIFPASVLPLLISHMENPKASSTADHELSRSLMQFDNVPGAIQLERLPFNAMFRIHNGKLFQKKERLRKRFRCISLKDGKVYLISPVAIVLPFTSSVSG